VDMAGAGVSYVFSYSSSTFAKGDRLHISWDASTGPDNVWLTCRWMLNWRT
jgi:hypothetical protein